MEVHQFKTSNEDSIAVAVEDDRVTIWADDPQFSIKEWEDFVKFLVAIKVRATSGRQ